MMLRGSEMPDCPNSLMEGVQHQYDKNAIRRGNK